MENSGTGTAWYREGSASDAPLSGQAEPQSQPLIEKTRQVASRVADQTVQQVKTQLTTQKDRATNSLQDVAQTLRETGESLQERNQGAIGQYAEAGAELVENVSGYFQDRSVEQIVGDVEEFARRQATVSLGGAFALGFMLSRFFKSSSPYGSAGRSTGGNGRLTSSAGAEWSPSASTSLAAGRGGDVVTTAETMPPPAMSPVSEGRAAATPAWSPASAGAETATGTLNADVDDDEEAPASSAAADRTSG